MTGSMGESTAIISSSGRNCMPRMSIPPQLKTLRACLYTVGARHRVAATSFSFSQGGLDPEARVLPKLDSNDKSPLLHQVLNCATSPDFFVLPTNPSHYQPRTSWTRMPRSSSSCRYEFLAARIQHAVSAPLLAGAGCQEPRHARPQLGGSTKVDQPRWADLVRSADRSVLSVSQHQDLTNLTTTRPTARCIHRSPVPISEQWSGGPARPT